MYVERLEHLRQHISFWHSVPLRSVELFLFFEVRVIAWRRTDIKPAVVSGRDSRGGISQPVNVFIGIFPLKPASLQGNIQGLTF